MEDEYLKNIWNKPDKEMDQFLNADDPTFERIQMKKIKSKLKTLVLKKIIVIILGIGWIAFIFLLIYFSVIYTPKSLGKVFFAGSLSAILLITSISVFIYIKDILTIRHIDNSGSITNTQHRLATLQLSTIQSVRVSWLQLPFYSTWYINYNMIIHGTIFLWIVQFLVTMTLTGIALWLYFHIHIKNIDKKWVRNFLGGTGFNSVTQATGFIRELDDYKKEK